MVMVFVGYMSVGKGKTAVRVINQVIHHIDHG